MEKITAKFIKYFMYIIILVITVCFILSSIFLSKLYINMQYKELHDSAEEAYNLLKSTGSTKNISIDIQATSILLVKDSSVVSLTNTKMGIMPFLKLVNFNSLQEKGKFKNPMNDEFLYYKYHSDIGDIVVLQNNKFSSNYLSIVYIILFAVFLVALLLSIPLISLMGKNFTKPILKLQKAAYNISQGNFDLDISINTKDEIEDLSNSIREMTNSLKKKYSLQRDFIANVSHDFKTPLSIIRNYSEAIYDDIVDDKNRKNYANEIIKEVDRLNYFVVDLIELSKLQDSNYTLKKTNFNLKDFLLDFKNIFKLVASKKDINIVIDSPDIEINADPKSLYRVVFNLVDNAIKFGFESTNVELTAIWEDYGIKVSIKNYGLDIDENMLDDIWNRYYKHSQSGGMGLGLAICSGILKMHGFLYGVKSIPNKETEFYFIIPKQ